MNRAMVRQQAKDLHTKRSAAAWKANGFTEDPGAEALIAKAKASRTQYPTKQAESVAAPAAEPADSIGALAPSKKKK